MASLAFPMGEPRPQYWSDAGIMDSNGTVPRFNYPEINPNEFQKIDWAKTHSGAQPWTPQPFVKPIGDNVDPEPLKRIIEEISKQASDRRTQEVLEWQDRYNRAVAAEKAVTAKLAELQNELERLKKENRNLRLRAGLARTVEDEPEGS